jgi:hypothetical protein
MSQWVTYQTKSITYISPTSRAARRIAVDPGIDVRHFNLEPKTSGLQWQPDGILAILILIFSVTDNS